MEDDIASMSDNEMEKSEEGREVEQEKIEEANHSSDHLITFEQTQQIIPDTNQGDEIVKKEDIKDDLLPVDEIK